MYPGAPRWGRFVVLSSHSFRRGRGKKTRIVLLSHPFRRRQKHTPVQYYGIREFRLGMIESDKNARVLKIENYKNKFRPILTLPKAMRPKVTRLSNGIMYFCTLLNFFEPSGGKYNTATLWHRWGAQEIACPKGARPLGSHWEALRAMRGPDCPEGALRVSYWVI